MIGAEGHSKPSIMPGSGFHGPSKTRGVFSDRVVRDNVSLAAEMSGHEVDLAYLNWVSSACGLRPIGNIWSPN